MFLLQSQDNKTKYFIDLFQLLLLILGPEHFNEIKRILFLLFALPNIDFLLLLFYTTIITILFKNKIVILLFLIFNIIILIF